MNEIKQHIENITDYLLTLTKEERLIWFKKNIYLKPLNYIKEIDNRKGRKNNFKKIRNPKINTLKC